MKPTEERTETEEIYLRNPLCFGPNRNVECLALRSANLDGTQPGTIVREA